MNRMNIQKTAKKKKTDQRILFGFFLLLFFIISAGAIGFYSIYKSHIDSRKYIDAVDLARDVQVELLEQFADWKMVVGEGSDYATYQEGYYSFSKHYTMIQDMLFNLKGLCAELDTIPGDIVKLRETHRLVSNQYISLMVRAKEYNFRNRSWILSQADGRDREVFDRIDGIVHRIKAASNDRIDEINRYYLNFILYVIIGLIVVALFLSINLVSKISSERFHLEKTVDEKTADLMEAHRVRKLSEEKYRLIVEGLDDIIFSMDESWNILSANEAVANHFKVTPGEIQGRNFIDLIYEIGDGELFNRTLVHEMLDNFAAEKKPIQFRADFKTRRLIEPRTLKIKLQYINIDGKKEILGTASSVAKDSLLSSLESEHRAFVIGNSLFEADEISHRLTRSLHKFVESGEVKMIRIALREMVINAIEHGNLDISFQDKSKAMESDDYFNLINERQKNPEYGSKRVAIDYYFNAERVVYRITDEGEGFEYRKYLGDAKESGNEPTILTHGRGIAMTKDIFDDIRYNTKGNEVMLVKSFS